MSECVVRMEMPKACWFCGLRFVCKAANDFLTTKETGCSVLKVGMKGCLIVCQLPEGHGDLISRYAIATACSNLIRTEDGEYWIKVGEVRESIKSAPTIVPAERSKT